MSRNALPSALALGVAIFVFASCGGGGSSGVGSVPNAPGGAPEPGTPRPGTPAPGTPTPGSTPTPGPPGPSSQTIETAPGLIVGTTGMFSPSKGDTSAGGQGQSVDGITCDSTMSNVYHVHIYVGVYINGRQAAIPLGLGMDQPGTPESDGFLNSAHCFYHIHTHDSSGIIHIEDPNPNNVPITQSLYTLKDLFDIWGITVNSNQFGPYTGPVRVFTTGQKYRGGIAGDTVPASLLTFYGTDPNNIPIYSFEVIDIEVGPTYPSSLPNVHFDETK